MSCYPEPDSHIDAKVKVVLDFTHCATKKELEHATCIDTSDWAVTKRFHCLKAEVYKIVIAKLVNVPTSLNNLKRKADIDKLITVPEDLKKVKLCSG